MTPFVQPMLFLALGVIMLWLAVAGPDSVIEIIKRFVAGK